MARTMSTDLYGTLVLVVDVYDVTSQASDLALIVKLEEVGNDLDVSVVDLVVLQDLFYLVNKSNETG